MKLTRKIRIGVIGAGRMGERHCRVYSGLGVVEFVGIGDTSPERGRAVANRYGVEYFEDHRDLLDRVDAVSVVTPTPAHYEVARECLSRGLHVLVEKPLASTVREAAALVELARKADLVLQVGHIERFNPAFLELESIVADLQVVALSCRRLSPFDTSNTDVDVVFDLMIHDVDIALALLGPSVTSMQAQGRSARTHGADFAIANLSMQSGAIAILTASRVTEQKVRRVEITALDAYVEADLLNKSISIYRRTLPQYLSNHQRPLRYRQEGLVEQIYIPTAEPLQLELQDFARAVAEGRRPKVSGEEGLLALQVATDIRERMRVSPIGSLQMPVAS